MLLPDRIWYSQSSSASLRNCHISSITNRNLRCNAADSVSVLFASPWDVTTEARPGELLYDVAHRAGVDITLGCCTGNCGVCEVEVKKFDCTDGVSAEDGAPIVVRSCVTPVPSLYRRIQIEQLSDAIWGLDGYDT